MPIGKESTTPNDIRVDAFLADDVQPSEGKLYALGLGWNRIFATSAPVQHRTMSVGLLIRVPYTRTNEDHLVAVEIVDADNTPIPLGVGGTELLDPTGEPRILGGPFRVGRPPALEHGDEQIVPMSMQLDGLLFPHFGRYVLRVLIDGEERERLPFKVEPIQGMLVNKRI